MGRNILFYYFDQQMCNILTNNDCIVKSSYMLRRIYIIFKESLLIYAKVTKSIN